MALQLFTYITTPFQNSSVILDSQYYTIFKLPINNNNVFCEFVNLEILLPACVPQGEYCTDYE